jgi:hypothetical protein
VSRAGALWAARRTTAIAARCRRAALAGCEGAGAQQRDRAAAGGARRAEREAREPILPLRPFQASNP